jgi:hypothetical protein
MAPSGTVLEKQLVIWAAGVTAAAALGYVVLGSYLPSFTWNRKMDETVPGLYNRYGNDCFANCVIQVFTSSVTGAYFQSLAGIPSFREYLKNRVQRAKGEDLKLDRSLVELLRSTC